MSVRSVEVWRVSCDCCQTDYAQYDWGYSVFENEGEAIEAALDSDWKHDPDTGKVTCESCAFKDETDG